MNAKRWWQSRTILGALAALIATIVRVVVPEAELEESAVLDLLTQGSQLAGAVLAIVGRFQANGRVTVTKKGLDELRRMHEALHRGDVSFMDPAHARRLLRADEPRFPNAPPDVPSSPRSH